MKAVAKSLRLDLAQFRELAAFAQFGSDLDAATKNQLIRGERMVELLKQGQFLPFLLEQQVMIIFAGGKGYLDDLPTKDVARFEKEFFASAEKEHPGIAMDIAKTRDLTKETSSQLEKALVAFKERFQKSK
ncbi:MAG: F-type H+-transporting ATPase subunit alpha [bacterium]|nr:MAG: F-type H+-transporting ATPase subunit alpha [bacterium]